MRNSTKACLVFAAVFIWVLVESTLVNVVHLRLGRTYGMCRSVAQIIAVVCVARVVFSEQWKSRMGLSPLGISSLVIVFLPMILPQVVIVRAALHEDPALPALVLIDAAAEEIVFRGMVFAFLRESGLIRATIGSATLFALVHVVVAWREPMPWLLTAVIMSGALGISFAAVREYVGLLPAVVVHAHWNMWVRLGTGAAPGQYLASGALLATVTLAVMVLHRRLPRRRDSATEAG